jgi:hypothetical protein
MKSSASTMDRLTVRSFNRSYDHHHCRSRGTLAGRLRPARDALGVGGRHCHCDKPGAGCSLGSSATLKKADRRFLCHVRPSPPRIRDASHSATTKALQTRKGRREKPDCDWVRRRDGHRTGLAAVRPEKPVDRCRNRETPNGTTAEPTANSGREPLHYKETDPCDSW